MLVQYSIPSISNPSYLSASSFEDFCLKIRNRYSVDSSSSVIVKYGACEVHDTEVMGVIMDQYSDAIFSVQFGVGDIALEKNEPSSSHGMHGLDAESQSASSTPTSSPSGRDVIPKNSKWTPVVGHFTAIRTMKRQETKLGVEMRLQMELEDCIKKHVDGPGILARSTIDPMLSKKDFKAVMQMMVVHISDTYRPDGPTLSAMKFDAAVGFVNLFPFYKDHTTEYGCEGVFSKNPRPNGTLEWRWKNNLRVRSCGVKTTKEASREATNACLSSPGPCMRRELSIVTEDGENIPEDNDAYEDQVIDAERNKTWLKFNASVENRAEVVERMRLTFKYRYDLLHGVCTEAVNAGQLLDEFPCYFIVPGLIDRDFRLLFPQNGDKLLESWTYVRDNIIRYSAKLVEKDGASTANDYIKQCVNEARIDYDVSDFVAMKCLLGLLPSVNRGQKKGMRISAAASVSLLFDFQEPGTDVPALMAARATHPDPKVATQPYLLVVGSPSQVGSCFVVIDFRAVPSSNCLVKGFDDLFKSHFVFSVEYQPQLFNAMTFIQTAVYGIDIGNKIPPPVRFLRAALQAESSQK